MKTASAVGHVRARIARVVLIFVVLLLNATGVDAQADEGLSQQNIALVNGYWFDGTKFEERTGYSVGGRFTFVRPATIDQTLNLAGTWLVPPFADAHSHSFGGGMGAKLEQQFADRYLEDGVFYVQVQGGAVSANDRAALKLNTPAGVDVLVAQSILTSSDSALHVGIEMMFSRVAPGQSVAAGNNRSYFEIDSEEELAAKWPMIRAQGSDFVKTYVSGLDDVDRSLAPVGWKFRTALSANVFNAIVAKAHAEGLRVSTHVTTAGDFRIALAGGADMLAHFPFWGRLTAEDASLCAEARVPVVTTALVTMRVFRGEGMLGSLLDLSAQNKAGLVAVVANGERNLQTLREAGVNIIVGADNPADTSAEEVEYLRSLQLWSNAELLRMWSTATPQAIFAQRKIGKLEEGYEASFLALEADPLIDWSATKKIRMRFKQGVPVAAREFQGSSSH
jgi:imidazolonepropionase-like amidohydrolase